MPKPRIILERPLTRKGQVEEAIVLFRKAVSLIPDFAEAHGNLGNDLLRTGYADEGILELKMAGGHRPRLAEASLPALGSVLLQKGRVDEAIVEFHATLDLQIDDDQAHYNLGTALRQKGQCGRGDSGVPERRCRYGPALPTLKIILATALSFRKGARTIDHAFAEGIGN